MCQMTIVQMTLKRRAMTNSTEETDEQRFASGSEHRATHRDFFVQSVENSDNRDFFSCFFGQFSFDKSHMNP